MSTEPNSIRTPAWYLAVPLFLLFAGCATAPDPGQYQNWQNVGYDGFAESIDIVAGSNARDCGFYNLMNKDARKAARQVGLGCAEQAFSEGVAFKFGTVRLPIDSYAYEVLIRSPDGENWLIVYDIIVDGTDPQIWFKKCESIAFPRRNGFYEGKDCIEYDGSNDPVWNGT